MKFVGDFGATLHASTVLIGEKLGLYKSLASSGGMSPADLSSKTHTAERYVREWLSAQAAAGYVVYDPKTGKYSMTPEQVFTLADENSPAYLPGAFYAAAAMFKDEPEITESFRTGKGVGWEKHSTDLFMGTEKFFRPGYSGNLVVVSVNQFQIGSVSSATVRAWFSVILVVFMFASALAYLSALQGNDVRQFNVAVLGYFSGLLGMVGGLAASTLYPGDFQLAGFLITGIILSAVFYWMLQKWHKNLQWNMRSS